VLSTVGKSYYVYGFCQVLSKVRSSVMKFVVAGSPSEDRLSMVKVVAIFFCGVDCVVFLWGSVFVCYYVKVRS